MRSWNPYRSKLAAAILNGLLLEIKEDYNILYLGAATGTTVSHLSDIVQNGVIYAVENSPIAMKKLLNICGKRPNIIPTLNDAFHEHLIQDYLAQLTADDDTKLYIAELISDFNSTLTSKKPALNDLVEQGLFVKEQYKMVTELIKNGPKLYTKFVEPVRDIIREFAIAMLRGVQSYLIINPDQEIQRLRTKV